ncbi:MAG: molybdopterin-binding protein [Pseudomonadota bacterium]
MSEATQPTQRRPTAAMIVIGDEILSGRTRDSNAYFLATTLSGAGISLEEVRMIADDHTRIVQTVNSLRAQVDHVFTSGGIGPTHDDITADAVAAAFNVPIDVRPDARELLEAAYAKRGLEVNEARLRMARIPDGAELIDNPVSTAPGFTIGNVHVMAGVPAVFREMVTGTIATIEGGAPLLSWAFRCEIGEGDLAGPLGDCARAFPEVSMGSYPFGGGAGAILILRHSEKTRLAAAAEAVRRALKPVQGVTTETPPPH